MHMSALCRSELPAADGFTQRLHGCECAGQSDLGSRELAILRTSWLLSVALSGLLDHEPVVNGEDAGAGAAASGVVPLARGAGDIALRMRSSRISGNSGMLETSPGWAAGTAAPMTRDAGDTAPRVKEAEPDAVTRQATVRAVPMTRGNKPTVGEEKDGGE